MFKDVKSEAEMKIFGASIGALFAGGEFVELVGDVGSGKTTLAKGIAAGLGVEDNIQSPSFTINRTYQGRDHLILSHYDFYRLNDAGVMADELIETINDSNIVTIIEWAGVIQGVLPTDILTVKINTISENSRQIEISAGGSKSQKLMENLKI